MEKRIFSGVRPSGQLHIGNYFGALKNWIDLQDSNHCVFGIVDYHAITTPFNPKQIRDDIFQVALDYLAAGVDAEKSILMIQSHVPEHTELAWILGTLTPISWLERVPTYKEKIEQHPDYINLGLLSYPVLMAADILIYKSNAVPVGADQLPHIELAREIARSFNIKFGQTFPEPKGVVGQGARIMSLLAPEKKMSKSLGPNHYIALADSPQVIKKKITSAVTDAGNDAKEPKRPGVANLFALLHLFSNRKMQDEFEKQYRERKIKYAELKSLLANDIAEYFFDFRTKRTVLEKQPKKVWSALEDGSKKARVIARETLADVKKKIGLS